MSSVIKFCPSCDSILDFGTNETNDSQVLFCRSCGYNSNSNITGVIKTKIVKNYIFTTKEYAKANPLTKYDPTLMKTAHIECVNPECLSNNPENWDEHFPQVSTFNAPDPNRTIHYLCNICGKEWFPK